MDIWLLLTIFMLSCFVGYFVIWNVTPALHSPLMSVTNAISGIIIIGALSAIENATDTSSLIFAYLACFFAALNIFGGFAISQRMLKMFKTKEKKQ